MRPALVIVGIGNHGASYANTRHNAGFMAADALSKEFATGPWKQAPKFQAEIQEARITAAPVLLVKPQTYMNLSGNAAGAILDFYKLPAAQHLLVLCDDIDIPLGTLRLRKTGGPGTHNGLKSLMERFGETFARLRIGIGPKPAEGDLAAWVLSAFTSEEKKFLDESIAKIPGMVKEFVES
jgi:PTH1 family peptidyl-tRNA hydrolase